MNQTARPDRRSHRQHRKVAHVWTRRWSLALATTMAGLMLAGCDVGAQSSSPTPEAASLTAPSDPATPGSMPNMLEDWMSRLRAVDADLRATEWARAEAEAKIVLGEMTGAIQGGNRAAGMMAMASLFRAIAEAGQGRESDAMWDWYVAESLHPGYADVDLSAYGAAGAVLARGRQADRAASGQIVDLTQPELADPTIQPPVHLSGPSPGYPASLRAACIEGTVTVKTLVDATGATSQPRLREAQGGPPMAVAALEAMRGWTFEPATLDGRAIPSFYNLSINFALEDCDGQPQS